MRTMGIIIKVLVIFRYFVSLSILFFGNLISSFFLFFLFLLIFFSLLFLVFDVLVGGMFSYKKTKQRTKKKRFFGLQ